MNFATIFFSVLCLCASLARAEAPLYAQKQEAPASFSWLDEIRDKVPPLRHARGTRWPMILWQAGPFEPQPPAVYKELLARGLTQHIHLDEKMIPTAQALQRAGSPVIMMQGMGGSFPYSLAGDPREWAHQFDAGYVSGEDTHACPAMTRGWAINADRIRATLQRFKDAGVTVNAVWMDWEVDPGMGEEGYEQASHCARCRATLPARVLANEPSFDAYGARKYVELTGTYLAAPVAEIFPGCSTTNWSAVVSSPERTIRGWYQNPFISRVPPAFTATNPVAYGMTLFFDYWKPAWKLDRERVDQMYTHLLLRAVSDDAANRRLWAPHMDSIPWVARWCAADVNAEDPRPIMTRERYREVLRHLWLRGIDGMQIYNSVVAGYEELALNEVQDAVTIYDEMLADRELLEAGEVLCLDVPKIQDDGVLWSGRRLGQRALLRLFKPGGGRASVTIEPWPRKRIRLEATSAGKTYRLELKGGRISKL